MRFFMLFLLALPLQNAFAQRWLPDTNSLVNDSFVKVPYQLLPADRYCFFGDTVIETDSALQALKEKCNVNINSIDVSRQVVMFRSEGGDCHARFSHKLYLDISRKKMVWAVLNIYGGCRAGGRQSFTLVAPKPPEGYTIEMITYLDNRNGVNEENWDNYWGE